MQTISGGRAACQARGIPSLASSSLRRCAVAPLRSAASNTTSSSGACAIIISSRSSGRIAPRHRRGPLVCRAADERGPNVGKGAAEISSRFNPVYLAIFGVYAGLLLLHNPYIYAVLTILTVLPQNSNVTSLNNLVLLFYESGLFMNFAEAVTCVRLVTWLSMGFMVGSFALFA